MRIKDDAPSPQPEKVFYDNRIKRKNVLALNDKVSAIREYERMPVYKRIGRMFNCSPDQIKRIVQQKDAILKAWEQRTRRCQDAKTLELKVVRVSMLGKAVYEWIRRMMYYKDFMITDGLIQKMALQFKSAMGLPNFFPHQEWCDKFRSTYKITVNDSKMLDIGYTQGHSVQIKDVMKDVLSECSPDGDETDDDDDNDDELEQLMDENLDDNDLDNNNEDNINYGNSCSERSGQPAIKKKRTITLKPNAQLTLAGSNSSSNSSSNKNNSNDVTKTYKNQQQQQRLTQTKITTTSLPTMPQLQPIRQLVALPIQTNGIGGGVAMTQKVLVATPITQNNVQRNGGNGGGAPMTMTIIPFTTLAQAQAQATQPPKQCALKTNVNPTATNAGGARKTGNEQRATVPPPMVEIKTEIKKEPEEVEENVYIKQEYISDDDETQMDVLSTAQQQQQPLKRKQKKTIVLSTALKPTPAAELPEGAAVKVNLPPQKSSDDTMDDDNLALASLRQLMRKPQSVEAANINTTGSGNGSTTRSARSKQSTLKSSSNSSTDTAAVAAAATVTSTAASSTTTRASSNKNKRSNNDANTLPPIKSCLEARRYLKLLEDFALYKENFRLIGLITRADEVLRELDGDDDVDID